MNNIIFSSLIFAGTFIIFSACNNNAKVETKQASITTTTSGTTAGVNTTTTDGTTSGSDEASTSGHMHEESMSSDLMKNMQSTMSEMKQMKMTGDPDYDFASMMVKHHEGGLKLTEEQISKGKSQELVDIAKTIKSDQEKEKKELKKFTAMMKPADKNQAFIDEVQKQMQMAESEMKNMTMKGNIDEDFAMMMAMHQKHGVKMNKAELKYGKDQKLKVMAEKAIDTQQKQIKELEAIEIASKE
jgi:uncharacterized protein (DUF305 family)